MFKLKYNLKNKNKRPEKQKIITLMIHTIFHRLTEVLSTNLNYVCAVYNVIFDTYIQCKNSTIKLINIPITLHNYLFYGVNTLDLLSQ